MGFHKLLKARILVAGSLEEWHIFSQTFKQIFIFGWILTDTDICEERIWSLLVPQSPVSRIVTSTHLKERGYLLLHYRDYLLSCVFAAIWQILRGGFHRFQINQPPKKRKYFYVFFLPQPGLVCLIIWPIRLLWKEKCLHFSFSNCPNVVP